MVCGAKYLRSGNLLAGKWLAKLHDNLRIFILYIDRLSKR